MGAYRKLQTIVITFATAILFTLWSVLETIMKGNIFLGISISALVSLGTYRFIYKGMEYLALRFRVVKKFILGTSYLDGIWIGAYYGTDNQPRYYVEYYEQDLEGIIVRGKAFNSYGEYKGTWCSEKFFVNAEKGMITYTYETDFINNSSKNQGLACMNLIRSEKDAVSFEMCGFSTDIFIRTKLVSYERKLKKEEERKIKNNEISDEILIGWIQEFIKDKNIHKYKK